MDKRQERGIKLVIASKYPAKPVELLKEAFNQMARLVGVPVYKPWIVNIAFRRFFPTIGTLMRLSLSVSSYRFLPIGLVYLNLSFCATFIFQTRSNV